MTPEEAKQVLLNHGDYFEYVERSGNCEPSDHRTQNIWNAFKTLNAHYHVDWNCGSCVFNMIAAANRVRKNEPAFYTFPKQ